MATQDMQAIQIGVEPDGVTPRYHYFNPGGHVVITGPRASGIVELPDGTTYDVSPVAIECDSHLHSLQVAALLEGRDPAHVTEEHTARVEAGVAEVLADVPMLAKDGE